MTGPRNSSPQTVKLSAILNNILRLAACAFLLLSAACAAAPTPAPTAEPTTTALPPTHVLPTATPPAIMPGAITKVQAYLDELSQYKQFVGVVLIGQQGKVLFGKGYGEADQEHKVPNTIQTRYPIDFVTWDFTAAAILLLQSQGKLSLQDPICKYVTDCNRELWKDITIYHLLSDSSGIPWFDDSSFSPLPATPEQIIASFKDKSLDFSPPGQNWQMSNSGYILLGYVIEKVSGLSYAEFMQRNIFTPLNLRNTGYALNATGLAVGYTQGIFIVSQTDPSLEYSSFGLYSSAEDLYQWDQALHSEKLFPKAYSDQFFALQFPDQGMSYTRGSITVNGRSGQYTASAGMPGIAVSLISFPDEQVTLVFLSNQDNVNLFGVIDTTIENLLFGGG